MRLRFRGHSFAIGREFLDQLRKSQFFLAPVNDSVRRGRHGANAELGFQGAGSDVERSTAVIERAARDDRLRSAYMPIGLQMVIQEPAVLASEAGGDRAAGGNDQLVLGGDEIALR